MAERDLIQLIRGSGEDWLLRIEGSEEQSAGAVRHRLDAAYAAYREKFPDPLPGEPEFNDETVRAETSANPHRFRALLQAISASSPMMVALVWRVIQGGIIQRIDMRYLYESIFEMRVIVDDEMTRRPVEFNFDQIEDATFLRHLGIMRAGNAGIFDGYYALNIPS